jgi:hypothetical protein
MCCFYFSHVGQGIANPGLQALWSGERTRRAQLNITDRLTPPTSPGEKQIDRFEIVDFIVAFIRLVQNVHVRYRLLPNNVTTRNFKQLLLNGVIVLFLFCFVI